MFFEALALHLGATTIGALLTVAFWRRKSLRIAALVLTLAVFCFWIPAGLLAGRMMLSSYCNRARAENFAASVTVPDVRGFKERTDGGCLYCVLAISRYSFVEFEIRARDGGLAADLLPEGSPAGSYRILRKASWGTQCVPWSGDVKRFKEKLLEVCLQVGAVDSYRSRYEVSSTQNSTAYWHGKLLETHYRISRLDRSAILESITHFHWIGATPYVKALNPYGRANGFGTAECRHGQPTSVERVLLPPK